MFLIMKNSGIHDQKKSKSKWGVTSLNRQIFNGYRCESRFVFLDEGSALEISTTVPFISCTVLFPEADE